MAAPTPDPGIAALAAERPCTTRRWFGNGGNATLFSNYNFFPWNGQNKDTPAGITTVRNTDQDVFTTP